LNVIQGRAEQLLRRKTLGEKDRMFVGVIVTQIEHISSFIRQLLTLARRPEPQMRSVFINDVVRRTWEVIGAHERTDGVALVLDLAETTPPIVGDPDQLQQVVLNLTFNAVQAAGRAGQVTVRTRVRKGGGDAGRDESVELEVMDTGPGIARAEQARVFEPFFTTRGMAGGTGLGLTICREIVLTHQGEIRVESKEGSETRFVVSLPVVNAATHQRTPSINLLKESSHRNGIA
jgi:signal transduction histidine kinase